MEQEKGGCPVESEKEKLRPWMSLQEEHILKRKQEQNILTKIERIVEKVVPIHEANYESENENDMQDLIEEIERMDIE